MSTLLQQLLPEHSSFLVRTMPAESAQLEELLTNHPDVLPCIEWILENSINSIFYTQTFKARYEMLRPKVQFDTTKYHLNNVLNVKNISGYVLVPELTKNGRIHYHGMIRYISDNKWVRTTRPQLNRLGRADYQNPENIWKIICYMFKDYSKSREYFETNNLCYSHIFREYQRPIHAFFLPTIAV